MATAAQTDPDFAFAGLGTPEVEARAAAQPAGGPADQLGPLDVLAGTWKGQGFNAIWRPHHPSIPQDRFLELNKTDETLVFTQINGPIPNRGLAMADIDMFGLTYMQQISESSTGAGLHIEPGIWAHGAAHDRSERAGDRWSGWRRSRTARSCSRRESRRCIRAGHQTIPDNNILPFFFGSPAPANSDFNSVAQTFTELNLSQPTPFRVASPGDDAGHRQEPEQRPPEGPYRLAPGHDDEEQERSCTSRRRTTSSRPAAAPRTRRSWPPAAIRPVATPGRRRSRPASGSRRSPERVDNPTSTSCSTPSECNSTSTASTGHTSPSPRW